MTTRDLLTALRQGRPITARLVSRIVEGLERLQWAENRLAHVLASYAQARRDGDITLTPEETVWICADLDEHAALEEAVRWMLDAMDATQYVVKSMRAMAIIEAALSLQAARAEVERLVAG